MSKEELTAPVFESYAKPNQTKERKVGIVLLYEVSLALFVCWNQELKHVFWWM